MRPRHSASLPWLALICATALAMMTAAQAQTYTALYSYSINAGNYSGIVPAGVMSQGRDGNLYSTIANAGTQSDGTIFRMTTAGQLTTLYNFCSLTGCADGVNPEGGVIVGFDGNFYGTANYGGSNEAGTVFKFNPNNSRLSTLWNFTNGNDDGNPFFGLLQAQNGSLWGVSEGIYNGQYGTLYKVSPNGQLTPYDFNAFDGSVPNLPTQASNGNFYGTTKLGGASANDGVVYKATPNGAITDMHDFAGYPSDGSIPVGILVQGNDGNFYGTTYSGGAHNLGTVFKVTPSGTLTLLYSFAGGSADGASPYTGLTLGTDGNFYGVTGNGGYFNAGTVFKITASGTFTLLHSFCNSTSCPDAFYPETPLVQHTNGVFYGNTSGNSLGGSYFYSLDVGLPSFVRLLNWTGKVGQSVEILGQGFTGTTAVSFNGTAATYTVVSDTYLTAVVPSGATSGFIKVTTPGGALKSDRKFLVVPSILSFSPTSGSVGTQVTITGTSFTGAKRVTFGGVRATTFSVDSDTQITATVPTGARTGKIQVSTSGGTATSATNFTVT
jgi:uncharacterized repeat protein (TIGR03803 family)